MWSKCKSLFSGPLKGTTLRKDVIWRIDRENRCWAGQACRRKD